jgi:hypothetical protein
MNSNFARGMQTVADNTAAQRPSIGKTVTINTGKYAKLTGIVFWHGVDKFSSTRYKTDAQLMMQEIIGREGYRCGIKLDNGDKVFVKASNVTVRDFTREYDEHNAALDKAHYASDNYGSDDNSKPWDVPDIDGYSPGDYIDEQ